VFHRIAHSLFAFLKTEEGPTAVEYAVMLALIVVICLIAITALGTSVNSTFGNVALTTAAS
jgi:pilus assembly protein Flp/PilA